MSHKNRVEFELNLHLFLSHFLLKLSPVNTDVIGIVLAIVDKQLLAWIDGPDGDIEQVTSALHRSNI